MDFIFNLTELSRENCDFCQADTNTARETWGRVRSSKSISAANMFRLAGPYNGIIISKQHSPIDLSLEDVWDMFECANIWFLKIHSKNPSLTHPMLIWDMFPKAGASQVHTHFQIVLDDSYVGHYLTQYNTALQYRSEHSRDYWMDLIDLHTKLGLGTNIGETYAISPLTSHRDNEVILISRRVDETFVSMLFAVIQIYRQELGIYCMSIGMSWPVIGSGDGYPAVLKIGTRGDCSSGYNDVSSLDLYSFYSVNSDPFNIIRLLKQAITK